MKPIIPPKLKPGDEIRVIAPSTTLAIIHQDQRELANRQWQKIGFHVTFSQYADEKNRFNSSSIEHRLSDLHDAFRDPQVKGILTAIGGYNANQLLDDLDYDLIAAHPKLLCGFSDITALSNAIFATTGLVTYSGPHYSTLSMKYGAEYTIDSFQKCVMASEPFAVPQAANWSDDAWYRNQERREFLPNTGYLVINEGEANGRLLGGNLCTFNLLQGTRYLPDLAGSILLIEDDFESQAATFDRDLQSLIHQPGFNEVQGLIIGRFQKTSGVADDTLIEIIRTKAALKNMPIIANASFGHTTPQFTFPVGGQGTLI
ncbi:MAG: LD-carboxypeptidase, partial [Anaerolineae bacterium]|nr:LD-carboxypeptidase [Anaerolineae bacterium]